MLHFPFIEIVGEPYALGRGHGESLRAGIHRQLDETLTTASRQGGSTASKRSIGPWNNRPRSRH